MKVGLQQLPRHWHQSVASPVGQSFASPIACKKRRLGSAPIQQLATGLQQALTAQGQVVKQSCFDRPVAPGRGSLRLCAQVCQNYGKEANAAAAVQASTIQLRFGICLLVMDVLILHKQLVSTM